MARRSFPGAAVAGVFTAVAGVFTAVAGVFTAVCFDIAGEVRKRTSCDVVVVVNVVVIVAVVVSAGAHTLLVDNACIQSASSSWHNLYSWKLGIGETGGNCNTFHINAHYVEPVFY